jgi:hypothetical protein
VTPAVFKGSMLRVWKGFKYQVDNENMSVSGWPQGESRAIVGTSSDVNAMCCALH